MTEEAAEFEIKRMNLKPGDIVLVKVLGLPSHVLLSDRERYIEKTKDAFSRALKNVGAEETQVIVMSENIDISILSAVELLGLVSSGETP